MCKLGDVNPGWERDEKEFWASDPILENLPSIAIPRDCGKDGQPVAALAAPVIHLMTGQDFELKVVLSTCLAATWVAYLEKNAKE